MKFIETIQSLAGNLFNLVGINRDPMFHGPIQVSTKAQRTLSHLVAQDGVNARLLRCTAAGQLGVVPLWLTRQADGLQKIVATTDAYWDMGTAVPRIIEATLTLTGADLCVLVYDSDSPTGKSRLLGMTYKTHALRAFAVGRYIEIVGTIDGSETYIRTWEI